MQKVYQRIKWENDPSTNTPLGANNLNKMDYALDQVDDRVVALSGYETRVIQSETNAKQSENNAKTSERNAKASEELAKQYMESAFNTTPDGYAQIVDKVEKMDIQTTTDTTLADSKEGGYKLLSMSGNSVQKTTTGKNFLSYGGVGTTTVNGITFTPVRNANGSLAYINVNGTATAPADFPIGSFSIKSGTYILNGCPSGGSQGGYRMTNSTGEYYSYGDETTMNIDTEKTLSFYIQVFSGKTVSNLKFYPMIRKASVTDATYEPYVGGVAVPNPDYPQSINNVGDCVEMMQGAYKYTDGTFGNSSTQICNRHPIPCKEGDKLVITAEKGNIPVIIYYKDGAYLSYGSGSTNVITKTVPSGATHFNFYVSNNNGVTPETVGKISVTVNGKFVVQIKTQGKNLLKNTLTSRTLNGITYTVNEDGSVHVNGTVTTANDSLVTIGYAVFKANETYILSGGAEGGTYNTYALYTTYGSGQFAYDWGGSVKFTPTEDVYKTINIFVRPNTTINNLTFYPMIRKADTDGTYEPHKEKVATVLLNAPLSETDVMSNKEVVRNRHTIDLGTLTWRLASNGRWESNKLTEYLAKQVASTELHNLLCTNYLADTYINIQEGVNNNRITIYKDGAYIEICDKAYTDATEFKNSLSGVMLEYELATPTTETLDTTSQIALNSLETFDGATYINVDSRTLPSEIKGEYGTSKVGARTIKNELKNDTLEIKYNELAVALVATESGV